jgi:hypothetical protein
MGVVGALIVYLAGPSFYKMGGAWVDVYLAGTYSRPYVTQQDYEDRRLSILESFFFIGDWMIPYIENHWDFLLDSGAFSFFGKKADSLNWEEYQNKYADFINAHSIDKFFELDIDILVGIEEVERLRERLISLTGKTPIVVWRPSRGIEYWQKMIEQYPYIAISASGSYDSRWTRNPGSEDVLRQMVKTAHAQGVKVHGLGYTNIDKLKHIGWDSIDSTTWVHGNRTGQIHEFRNGKIIKHKRPEGTFMPPKQAAIHNFDEWVKFQQYALTNL